MVPNTGYDYGISAQEYPSNAIKSIKEMSHEEDSLAENEYDEIPIPPPVYEDHNFFDFRKNRYIEN